MGHAPRTPRCSMPASARMRDTCWPRRPSAVARRTGRAVVEQLGALLTPVAGPVGAGGAVAVEAGKDVEGVGSGHDALLEWLIACWGDRPGPTAKLIALGLLEYGRPGCGPGV